MFGSVTQYVETLDAIVEFVSVHQPTTDELVGWHRGAFERVSSRDSIMLRVSYLQLVGFIQQDEERVLLGEAGQEYVVEQYFLQTGTGESVNGTSEAMRVV